MKKVIFLVFCLHLAACTQRLYSEQGVLDFKPTASISGGAEEKNPMLTSSLVKLFGVTSGNWWNICTGIQIEKGIFLTAAHCYYDSSAHMADYLVNDIYGNGFSRSLFNEESHKGAIALLDPNFDSAATTFKNDLAIYFSYEFLSFKNSSLLPLPSISDTDLPEELYISGYGLTEGLNQPQHKTDYRDRYLQTLKLSKTQNLLKEINSELVGDADIPSETIKILADLNHRVKTQEIYCFLPTTGAALPGDSGGPLYSLDSQGTPTLHGVFSMYWANSKNQLRFFCYTNIARNLSWINQMKSRISKFGETSKIQVSSASENYELATKRPWGVIDTPSSVSGQLVAVMVGSNNDDVILPKDSDFKNKIVLIDYDNYSQTIDYLMKKSAAGFLVSVPNLASDWSGYNGGYIFNALQAKVRIISDQDKAKLIEKLKRDEKIEVLIP